MSELTLLILIGVLVLSAIILALALGVALGAASAREDARRDRQLLPVAGLIRTTREPAAPAEDHAGARLSPGEGERAAPAHRGGAAPPAPIWIS